jgi:bla regulator protein blaR1
MRTESRELLAVGLFGSKSRIGVRIETLLRRGRTFSPRASASGVVASTVILGGLLLAGSLAPRWIAFAQAQPRLTFEVSSIKPSAPDERGGGVRYFPGTRMVAQNATLRLLVQAAYGLREFQVTGGAAWMNTERYDITARGEDGAQQSQLDPMLQGLLGDRFKLTIHREIREMPVFFLMAAKGGIKLVEPKDGSCVARDPNAPPPTPGQPPPNFCGRMLISPQGFDGTKIPMKQLTLFFSDVLGRPVFDKTEFKGTFDAHLEYARDQALAAGILRDGEPGGPVDSSAPSIFSAVQEQLGLQLKSAKGPVEYFVIDHAEKPDAN